MSEASAASDFIAFEGPIGVGKTTLTELIGTRLRAKKLFERPEFNEYLADFYVDRERYALQMQMSFLMDRAEQLRGSFPVEGGPLVADYTLAKDKLFAELLLRDRDLRLYAKARKVLSIGVPEPRLLVYLDAETDLLLERIRKRNRPYEQSIDAAYLDRLRSAYEAHAMQLDPGKVLRLDSATINISDAQQLDELARRLAFRQE